jgi:ribose/xylose/arabinose/galactoside ABC-type transport system permease subunit
MVGLAMVLFLDLATATTAPWWVTVLLLLLWALCFGLACAWFVRRPRLVPWLPVLAFLVWAPVIAVGTRQLGWGS